MTTHDNREVLFRRGVAGVLAFIGLAIVVPGIVSPDAELPTAQWVRYIGFACIVAALLLCVSRPRRFPLGHAKIRRVLAWTAAVVLVLALYVLSFPFVAYFDSRHPVATPVVRVVYAPLVLVLRNQDAPGHDLFAAYVRWCGTALRKAFH